MLCINKILNILFVILSVVIISCDKHSKDNPTGPSNETSIDYAFITAEPINTGGHSSLSVDLSNMNNPSVKNVSSEILHLTQSLFLSIDLSNMNNPSVKNVFSEILYWTPSLFLSGNYAFLASHKSLIILNINNPTVPLISGNYTWQIGEGRDIQVENNYAFIANGNLEIVDISDKNDPKYVGLFNCDPSFITELFVSGNTLFSCSYGKLLIFDISNKTNPILLSKINIIAYGDFPGIYVRKGYLYSSQCIINVSNLSDPKYVKDFNFGFYICGYNDKIYALSASSGQSLKIFDISN